MEVNQAGGLNAKMPSHPMTRRSMGQVELQQQIIASEATNTASSWKQAESTNTDIVHIPSLPSLGLLNDTHRFARNPANSYVRSFSSDKTYHVNTSYQTLGLIIRQKRFILVKEISALLGDDPDRWFAVDRRPHHLPWHPLDWSTVILREIRDLAAKLPNSHTIDQRRSAFNQSLQGQANGKSFMSWSATVDDKDTAAAQAKAEAANHEPSAKETQVQEIMALKVQIEGLKTELAESAASLKEQVSLSSAKEDAMAKETSALKRRLVRLTEKETTADEIIERKAWLELDHAEAHKLRQEVYILKKRLAIIN